MREFDGVAREYDEGRPGYPQALLDALLPLEGSLVVEGGAGTGIASRALLDQGAIVVAFDTSVSMLREAVENTPTPIVVLADGARCPVRSGCVDLVCYAQAWHWVDPALRVGEVSRVLRVGGRWAGWWSHPRSDGEPWFDALWDLVESACPTASRRYRDIDWSVDFQGRDDFDVQSLRIFPWVRQLTIEQWLIDERSKSYVARLDADDRERLVADIERLLRAQFPSGAAQVDYETWLWTAKRIQ